MAPGHACPGFSLDAGYSKLHLDSVGGIAYIVASRAGTLITGESSLYFSNLHTAYFGIRFALKNAPNYMPA
jgi:hypothetical protein